MKQNIYLITEDGESFCVKAETMNDAISACIKNYIKDVNGNEKEELEYYHEQILQSCQLIGELKN